MEGSFLIQAFVTCLRGVPMTLLLAGVSLVCGGVLAVMLAALRLSGAWLPDALARAYVFVFRGTPLLVQVFIVYYGLGQFRHALQAAGLWAFFRDPLDCAVFSLSLCTAAYTCEILRAGVLAIPAGQIEAGRACGMSRRTLFRRIVAPLALRAALPAYGNEVILLVKATSLASLITINEVTFLAQKMISETYRATEVFLAAGSIYLAINLAVARAFRLLERHLSHDRRPSAALPLKETPDA